MCDFATTLPFLKAFLIPGFLSSVLPLHLEALWISMKIEIFNYPQIVNVCKCTVNDTSKIGVCMYIITCLGINAYTHIHLLYHFSP